MSIEATYAGLDESRSAWTALHDLLVKGGYDTSTARPSLAGQSIAEFDRRAGFIFEGLLALKPADQDSAQAAFLASRAPDIGNAAKTFHAHASSLVSTLRMHWREGGSLKALDGNLMLQVIQQDGSVVTSLDMGGNLQPMDTTLGQLAGHLSFLLPLCRADAVGDLSVRAAALGDLTREMEALRDHAKRIADAASTSASVIDSKETEAQALVAQAETALANITAHQFQANTDAGAVTALVERIKTIAASADTLEKMVAGYTTSLEAFKGQLDARNAEFEKFQVDAKAAREENEKRNAEIERLIKQSDGMISGATTAGLSKSMEDARARYEARMVSARRGFYVAVALLAASAIPLVLHLTRAYSGLQDGNGGLYAFIGRILLMLPATWLTAFFAKSYSSFFDLEREYAHKAALAMSVDGFKRQAPKYEEEITADPL